MLVLKLYQILFDNSIYASENFGDAMKWYENRSLDSDPKYHYMIGLKAEKEELIEKAIKHFSLAAEKDYTLAQIRIYTMELKNYGIYVSRNTITKQINQNSRKR